MAEEKTRAEIRSRISARTLPRCDHPRVFGGNSDGSVCEACGRAIACGDMEFEVEQRGCAGQPFKLTMHRECFGIWQRESKAPVS